MDRWSEVHVEQGGGQYTPGLITKGHAALESAMAPSEEAVRIRRPGPTLLFSTLEQVTNFNLSVHISQERGSGPDDRSSFCSVFEHVRPQLRFSF